MNVLRNLDTFVIGRLRAGMAYALARGWAIDGWTPDVAVKMDSETEGRIAFSYRIKRTHLEPPWPVEWPEENR